MPLLNLNYQFHQTGLLPLCDVIILGKNRRVPIRAVIDSGATHPIFPQSAAIDAGLDLLRATPMIVTFGGSQALAQSLDTYVELAEKRLRLRILFVERIQLGYALLGRGSFFNQFNEVAFIERIKVPRVELRD